MPKLGFTRLPSEEEAICLRVRELRLAAEKSQAKFAEEFGLNRERLASYEYARAPIRWGFGNALCWAFRISHRWLAEGAVPIEGAYLSEQLLTIPADSLFSEGYKQVAPDLLRRLLPEGISLSQIAHKRNLFRPADLAEVIAADLRALPKEKREEYSEQMRLFSRSLMGQLKPHPIPEQPLDSVRSLSKYAHEMEERFKALRNDSRAVHARLILRLSSEGKK